jgi:hypothetical protein
VHPFAETYISQLNISEVTSVLEASRKLSKALEYQKESQHSQTLLALISRLLENGVELINFETREVRQKVLGLCILFSILDISDTDTSMKYRIADLCKKLMEGDKMSLEVSSVVLRLASICVGMYTNK